MHPFIRQLPFVFITGGCRSGKSAYAQRLAHFFSPKSLFIATAQVDDIEMQHRIHLHQQTRGANWRLYEMPREKALSLWQELPDLIHPKESVLLDCLSLWTATCSLDGIPSEDFIVHCRQLLKSLQNLECPIILVHSEVGLGIVPSTTLGRTFRDMAGLAGQEAARIATTVIFMVSGIPLAIKGELPIFP